MPTAVPAAGGVTTGLSATHCSSPAADSLQLEDPLMHSSSLKQPPIVCHGRVKESDFERMVPAQWWKTVFADALYLKTDGDVVEDPEITREEIRMLEANPAILSIFKKGSREGEKNSAKVLDLCCGQGRHTLLLAEKYPHLELYGHDQSSYLVNLARERAESISTDSLPGTARRRSQPEFTVGDCRTVPFDNRQFDFVMIMGNSFGYFSANDTAVEMDTGIDSTVDAADRQVLREINRVLCLGGRMVLDLVDGDYMRENFNPRSWEWIDDQTFACRERSLSADKRRLHSREVVVVANRGVVRDQFYSERLYGRQELVELLREAGFDIESSGGGDSAQRPEDEGVNTVTAARELSQRGQDLGMMEQRLLIYAHKVRDHPLAARNALQSKGVERSARHSHQARASPDCNALVPTTSVQIAPENYCTLGTPPFPNGEIALVMGDPSLSCREKLNGVWNPEDFDTRRKLLNALLECGFDAQKISILESHNDLLRKLMSSPPSFVFNLCDEGFDNDATKELHIAALLEMCKIPYSGAGPASLAICYDKGLVNATAAKLDIFTPRETYILLPEALDPKDVHESMVDHLISLKEETGDIQYPAFLKPMKGDNSLGITGRSICHNRNDLSSYLCALVEEYGFKEFIVQEYLTGTEYSVGMIGNPETGFHFLPILQVDYSKVVNGYSLQPILGWESKWDPDSPYWNEIDYVVSPSIPSSQANGSGCACNHGSCSKRDGATSAACSDELERPEELMTRGYVTGGLTADEEACLKRWCAILFERFGLRDYARFDWRADREVFYHPTTGHRCVAAFAEEAELPLDASRDTVIHPITIGSTISLQSPAPSAGINDDASSESSDSARGSLPSAGGNPASVATSGQDRRVDRADSSSQQSMESSSIDLRRLKLLEVNPNPGWCWDGKLAKMMHADGGKSYADMIKSILWASWFRVHGTGASRNVVTASSLASRTANGHQLEPQHRPSAGV